MNILQQLTGKDLRSVGEVEKVIPLITSQAIFDDLFKGLFHDNRLIVMRAADAIEKITLSDATYLQPHKNELIKLLTQAVNKELKWHLALLVARLNLTKKEAAEIYQKLSSWALNVKESRIVRVNALQGMYELAISFFELKKDFKNTLDCLNQENIPSLKARIKKLKMNLD